MSLAPMLVASEGDDHDGPDRRRAVDRPTCALPALLPPDPGGVIRLHLGCQGASAGDLRRLQASGEPADRDLAAVEQMTVDGQCPHCGHALDQHDRVALRYCNASGDHAKRGCICPGQITTAADATAASSASG